MSDKSTIDKLDSFGEDTVLGLSVKTLIAVGMTIALAVSGYSMIKRDVEIAKELPYPEVTAEQFRLQTEIIDNAILDTKSDINDIKKQMDRMESRLFETSRR
tara:strand:- start:6553 stop:6858 length:306 start_codon:yes stop_codon:yes gene_type:complete